MNDLYERRFIKNSKTVFSENFDYDADVQINLPQYCDDLLKVVKCTVNSFVIGTEMNDKELKIFGKSKIDLTYISCTENMIKSYETEEEFVKTISVDTAGFDIVNYKTRLIKRYENCRVINQRRIDLHISFTICAELFASYDVEVLDSCEKVKTKCKNINYLINSNNVCKKFDFSEVAEISGSCSIKSIVNYFYSTCIEEIKVISGKVLVKSILNVSVTYVADNENDEIVKFTTSLPISRIVDVNGVEEDNKVSVKSCVNNFYVKAKSDSSGNLTMLDLTGVYNVDVDVYSQCDEMLISDAYSTKSPVTYNKNKEYFKKFYSEINDTCSYKAPINFESQNIKQIYDLNLTITKTELRVDKTIKIISGVLIEALILNEDDEIVFIKTEDEISYDTSINNENTVFGICNMEIKSFDYVIASNTQIDLRLETQVFAMVYENTEEEIITELDFNEETQIKTPALVVYFAKTNETVWNIAKKFNSDEKLIMLENDLSSAIIDNPRVLLIPGV